LTQIAQLRSRMSAQTAALLPGFVSVGLMILWAAHDGGYDADTWYWGALVTLGLLTLTVATSGTSRLRASKLRCAAIACFALYVAWSYLSISWATASGTALEGSNRALLYLLTFTLLTALPWTPRGALLALVVFAVGVGAIAVVLLFRLASSDHVASLFFSYRLVSPTGYLNSTAALFSIEALTATGLATRSELPAPLRGVLLALAAASLQLAVVVQSRGWLFTLPVVILFTAFCVRDRIRLAIVALVPIAATLIPVHQLIKLYDEAQGSNLNSAAAHAGQEALLLLLGAFVAGTVLAWADRLAPRRALTPRRRALIGGLIAAVAIVGGGAGGLIVSHGRPFHFIARQWNGFSHPEQFTANHFNDVGTSRYDFWRVSLKAFAAHPLGGLGQDNFGDYYVVHRRSDEEPSWTHSLELRLLVHTGAIGFGLFVAFLVLAVTAAVRARRHGPPLQRAVVGIALLALVVWIIHGSLDWFWEMPALAGPALGFLAIAGSFELPEEAPVRVGTRFSAAVPGPLRWGLGAAALVAMVVVLGFPYLSVREVSIADDIQAANPQQALRDFTVAARLNPLSAVPGRLAGGVALTNHDNRVALARFRQSSAREPGGWFAWLGAGLAASALGQRNVAHHYFSVAYSINSRQPAVRLALARVLGRHPLTSGQAFSLLNVA
jgi:O-antigen ligase/polysaccharide polymerase Wzy-like membrane protein